MSWDNFTDQQHNNKPVNWDPPTSNAPNVTSTSPKNSELPQNSRSRTDDVASIISSLSAANSAIFGQPNSVLGSFSSPNRPNFGQNGGRTNIMNLDEAVISDSGSDLFNGTDLKDALSAISAPVVAGKPPVAHSPSAATAVTTAGVAYGHPRMASSIFGGAASVAGVGVSNLKGSSIGPSNFLQKFSSVTEKTRELERRLGKISMTDRQPHPDTSRRFSGSRGNSTAIGSARGSFSGASAFRDQRKPSFSEKLDSYMNSNATSPVESRHLSFSSDANGNVGSDSGSVAIDDTDVRANTIWNPATTTAFYPQQSQQQQQQQAGMVPAMPFMVPPPGANYMQMPVSPFMFPMPMYGGSMGFADRSGTPADENHGNSASAEKSDPSADHDIGKAGESSASSELKDTKSGDFKKETQKSQENMMRNGFFSPGLMRPPMSPFMPPFNPYGPTPTSPPTGTIPIAPGMPSPVTPGASMNMGMTPPYTAEDAKPAAGDNAKAPMVKGDGSTPLPGSSPYARPSRRLGRSGKPKKHIYRSPLLEEFRNNKSNKHYTLKDIMGHGYEFSKDQHGSRFIQQQLSEASDEDKEMIFNEIRNYSIDLMTDVFGNYVIQKYFEFGNDTQRHILFQSMGGNFNFLSLQMYGCRVVQKCLESVSLEDRLQIVEELKPNILNLVKDQNGNHVIQKVIECVPTEKTPFILESLKKQIYHLSTHPYGCRVIQRLLEYSGQEDKDYILAELKGFIYYLVQDQFGNYVIQHIIEHGSPEYTEAILKIVIDNLVDLSKHKFASNAVEKCIIHQDKANRDRVFAALMYKNEKKDSPPDQASPLNIMIKDPFANYVVQKMVELVTGEQKELLVAKIRQYLELITKSSAATGKHLASIDKLIALTEHLEE